MVNTNPRLRSLISAKISKHGLPVDFDSTVANYYLPLAFNIAERADDSIRSSDTPLLVGVFGSQGSGKSTFADFLKIILEQQFGMSTVVMSLDDFYLTRQQRSVLSTEIHPLLMTRGVPGTHDIKLLQQTIDQLKAFDRSVPVSVPIFDKAIDDRAPPEQSQSISIKPRVIVLEGWCVGVRPQRHTELNVAVNELESSNDKDGSWRQFVNQQLADVYAPIFAQLDTLIALVAPSFDCVHDWRSLQEAKLIEKLESAKKSTEGTMSEAQIDVFIAHYQRLTEHALATLPSYADWCLKIDKSHEITGLTALANSAR
jgi:D-glycerate 3-kinase